MDYPEMLPHEHLVLGFVTCVLNSRQPVPPHDSWAPVLNGRAELRACRSKSGMRLPCKDGQGGWISV